MAPGVKPGGQGVYYSIDARNDDLDKARLTSRQCSWDEEAEAREFQLSAVADLAHSRHGCCVALLEAACRLQAACVGFTSTRPRASGLILGAVPSAALLTDASAGAERAADSVSCRRVAVLSGFQATRCTRCTSASQRQHPSTGTLKRSCNGKPHWHRRHCGKLV